MEVTAQQVDSVFVARMEYVTVYIIWKVPAQQEDSGTLG